MSEKRSCLPCTIYVVQIQFVLQQCLLSLNRKDSGSFDLSVNGLTITQSIVINSDETGRPVVSSVDCAATVGGASIHFHGGAR